MQPPRRRPTNYYSNPGRSSPAPREEVALYSIGGSSSFEVSIGSLDEPSLTVHAMFRPAELSLDQATPWAPQHTRNGVWLEFSGAVNRGASIELFLDASEDQRGSVARDVRNLAKLGSVRQLGSRDEKLSRPHHCVLVFGNVFAQTFRCVIESLATKYTRFSPWGEPTRATVTLKLKEANWLGQPPRDETDGAPPPATGAATGAAAGAAAGTPPATGAAAGTPPRGTPPRGTDADWECE